MTRTGVDTLSVGEAHDEAPAASAGGCIHELFAAQAQRMPDAIAVEFEGHRLSYAALDHRANQLAHRLRRLGVGAETLVGICVERSLDMVVGLLGILKAGGGYVPLDPGYPGQRLAFLMEDAAVPVVVAHAATRDRVPAGAATVLCLDAERDTLAREPAEAPASEATPDSLAYAIYTSGSTGNPKGVLVTHRNVTRLFRVTGADYGFGPQDAVALIHSYAFDFSVLEIWGALFHGGRLVVVPGDTARAPDRLHRLLRESGVTVLGQTPSAFWQLVAQDAAAPPLERLRLVILGGEALSPARLRPWFGRYGATPRIVNNYGPTETTVLVTLQFLSPADLERGGSPIGRPLADITAHLLDGQGHPTPQGEAGELYIGGAGVARGYLNRPELTAQRFLPDRFAAAAGDRLYRTGDLCRRLPDGTLDYIGRIDTQVKIRGFRIELGEIEAALARHPAVRDCAVTVWEPAEGDQRLVAHVVPAQPGDTAALRDGLRAHLRETLPEHMVPAFVMTLPAMPLTGSGKIDRRGLPVPAAPPAVSPLATPQDPTEALLAAIWTEVLGLPAGPEDNFFDLGGTSMSLAEVQTGIRRRTGRAVEILALFTHPTIAAQARYLRAGEARPSPVQPSASPLGRAARQRDALRRLAAGRGGVS